RRGRRDDDEVDIDRRSSRGRERGTARMGREIAREFVIRGDVALADAGALDDPLVAGVDDRLELAIGDEALRQVTARAGNAREAARRGAHIASADGSTALSRAISS